MRRSIFVIGVIAGTMAALLWISPGAQAQAGKKGADKKATDKKVTDKKAARDTAAERALLKETQKVETAHVKDLDRIAQWAAGEGLKSDAARLHETMRKLEPEYPGLAKLKATIEKAPSPKDEAKVPELAKTLAKKVEDANETHARRLFVLAANCMKFGLFTRAYDLINQVVAADPDHKRARDVLGYAWDSSSKSWITKWEAEMRKKHFLTEEGWVKKEDKAKWDKGLREYQSKWVTKEEEERIRKRNNYNPFSVETEHFRVETNLGRQQAFLFALDLEDFYREFFRFYLGYYDQTEGEKLFFAPAKLKKKHKVMVFPSREDYLTFVKSEKGNHELLVRSAGFFSSQDARSFFYWSDDRESTFNTLYHEVTHQLLAETKEWGSPSSGRMWVVEGIATYMETWLKDHGKWYPGAKVQIPEMQGIMGFLKQDPEWTIGQYISIEHEAFHKEPARGFNYAMGAALCHFFLHGQDEIYREPFIRFLKAFYEGKTSGDGVLGFLDVEGAESDTAKVEVLTKQLREHMAKLESQSSKPAGKKTTKPKVKAKAKSKAAPGQEPAKKDADKKDADKKEAGKKEATKE